MRICKECDRKVLARGLCDTHYSKYHKAGTLELHALPNQAKKIDYDRVRSRYASVTMDQWILMRNDDYFFGLLAALCEGSPDFQRLVVRVCDLEIQVAA